MAQMWSPEDEEGFGIRGADKDALTEEQQKALNDLRVETARHNQEYLHDHPEVKAMLSLLIRETLLQDRDVRSVAGELFRCERRVVAAVRRMLGMAPTPVSAKKHRSDDEGSPVSGQLRREVTFSTASVLRRQQEKDIPSEPPDKPSKKRRDTPAPWIQTELLKLTDTVSQDADERQTLSWLHRELENLAYGVEGRSTQGAGHPAHWMHSGKSSSLLLDKTSHDDLGEGEEDVIPLGRRDTPAPWSVVEKDLPLEKKDKETYVLGLLEKILEDPTETKDHNDAFDRLQQIIEEAE